MISLPVDYSTACEILLLDRLLEKCICNDTTIAKFELHYFFLFQCFPSNSFIKNNWIGLCFCIIEKLLAFGTPEEIVKNKNSVTAKYLKEKL